MGWKEAKDPQGRVYYYNDEGQTTWEKPEELFTAFEKRLLSHGWKSALTEDGKVYYYKPSTGETTWEAPIKDEVVTEEEQKLQLQQQEQEQNDTQDSGEVVASHEFTGTLDDGDGKYSNNSKLLVARKASSKEEAEKAFLQMLADYQVDSTWSFDRIISEIGSKDARYWMVDDDPLWKQAMFDKFLSNRSESELINEHKHLERFEQAFVEMLSKLPTIHYYSRWPTIKRQIMNEPIYKHSVVAEKQKRRTFLRYIAQLQQEHQEQNNKVRNEALKELTQYFVSISDDIEPVNVPWSKFATKYLWGSPRFDSNKNFKSLTKGDVFQKYTTFVEEKMTDLKARIEEHRRLNYRSDRKARDAFKELLNELSPPIKYSTTWKDVYPLLKDDSRFTAMLGRNGSSALDLFLDKVEESELVMRAKSSVANQVLISNNLDLETSSMEEISTALKQSVHLNDLSSEDITSLINRLKESHYRKKQEARRRELEPQLATREAKIFEDKLINIFSTKDLTLGPTSSWDDVLNQIKDDPSYQVLSPDLGKLIFENLANKGITSRKRHLEAPKSITDLDY